MIFLLPHTPQDEYAAESKAYWNKYFAEKKQKESALAAAENPNYSNKLLKNDGENGIIASNKQHLNRNVIKEKAIKRAINSDKPAFDDVLYANYNKEKIPAGYYGVALHGKQYSAFVYDEKIDSQTLANIINARGDYNGEPIYLISCHTGKTDEKGNCFAQQLSDSLGVMVKAPDTYAAIDKDGDVFISTKRGVRISSEFVTFTPKQGR